jgi:glycosyltransferase involved in cell wall biosynthesis
VRILIVSKVPLSPRLGAGRALTDEIDGLRQRGVQVETFDVRDAFASPPRLERFRPMAFGTRARDFVRRNAARFDVVESVHGTFPYSRRELGFDGVLVARSTGLVPLYLDYKRYERARWPGRISGTVPGRVLERVSDRRRLRAWTRTVAHADVIRVLNPDEVRYLDGLDAAAGKVLELPEGLPREYAMALEVAAASASERLDKPVVAFVGSWCLRKGAADWPTIMAKVRESAPGASFRFLGTGVSSERVRSDLSVPERGVEVVPTFAPVALPKLLRDVTVGVFPSYIEGWGLGLVELLAAKIPTVSYDVPGPRTILRAQPLLVPRGNAEALARRVVEILRMDESSYRRLASTCAEIGRGPTLEETVDLLLERYEAAARKLARPSSARDAAVASPRA